MSGRLTCGSDLLRNDSRNVVAQMPCDILPHPPDGLGEWAGRGTPGAYERLQGVGNSFLNCLFHVAYQYDSLSTLMPRKTDARAKKNKKVFR